jgi:uncharacterized protein DUF4124
MRRTVLLIFGLLFAAGAMAQQYKWVDQNGRVQYGDTPPPGVKGAPMRPPSGPASPPADPQAQAAKKGPMTAAEKEADFRKRQLEAEKDRQKQAQASQAAEDKRENCSRAQETQRSLETGRVARTDAKGERYFLDERQIASETANARQRVQQWCN